MDNPGHALAASLAQTETLLAVAAAIDRLAGALSHPGPPAPATDAGTRADPVAVIRKQYPNAYTPWIAEADEALAAAHRAGHDMTTLASTFGRQPSAIRSRLNRLGASTPAEESAGPVATPAAGS